MISIYGVHNKVNGKYYIGQSVSVNRRWNAHKSGKGSKALANAIKKYGLEAFEFFIIASSIEDQETADAAEEKYIKEYNALYPNGYNMLSHSSALTTSKIPDDIQQEAINLYLAFVPMQDIADTFNISRGAIDKILNRHNVTRRGKPHTRKSVSKIDRDRLIALIEQGYNTTQLAEAFNTNRKYIWKYIKTHKVPQNIIREYNTRAKRDMQLVY